MSNHCPRCSAINSFEKIRILESVRMVGLKVKAYHSYNLCNSCNMVFESKEQADINSHLDRGIYEFTLAINQ